VADENGDEIGDVNYDEVANIDEDIDF